MKKINDNEDVHKALRLTDANVYQNIRQIKIGVFVSLGLLVAFVAAIAILEMSSETFEKSARYRPPQESVGEEADQTTASTGDLPVVVQGQVVYVPAYSHIYHQDGTPTLLTITLSIRNTSVDREIVVETVRYFDTSGKEVKSYLKKPLRLSPMATTEFLVERDDTSGGSGANFLVRWVSDAAVSEPIIEAVMIDTDRQQGISFARTGKVIEEVTP